MTDKGKRLGFYCSSGSFGGLELHTVRLAGWLRDRGWFVQLYLLPESPMAREAEGMGLVIRPISRNKKYFDIAAASRISRLLKRDRIDVLWLRDNRDLSVAGIAKSLSGNRLRLVYQQAMELGVSKRDLFHTMRFKKIDAWLASLESMAGQVKRRTRMPEERLHVVPLGLEMSKFTGNRLSKAEARKALELPQEPVIIGNIGRFGPKKQQDLLVKGLGILRKKGHEVHLLLQGESTRSEGDAYLRTLHELIKALALEACVHIRPFMDDVAYFYSSIDVFALSSLRETYGMVTVEAMASGLPIVATNSGGTVELLKAGELGLLFDPESETGFADIAASLLEDKDKMKRMGALVRQEALERYTHERECQKIEAIIGAL